MDTNGLPDRGDGSSDSSAAGRAGRNSKLASDPSEESTSSARDSIGFPKFIQFESPCRSSPRTSASKVRRPPVTVKFETSRVTRQQDSDTENEVAKPQPVTILQLIDEDSESIRLTQTQSEDSDSDPTPRPNSNLVLKRQPAVQELTQVEKVTMPTVNEQKEQEEQEAQPQQQQQQKQSEASATTSIKPAVNTLPATSTKPGTASQAPKLLQQRTTTISAARRSKTPAPARVTRVNRPKSPGAVSAKGLPTSSTHRLPVTKPKPLNRATATRTPVQAKVNTFAKGAPQQQSGKSKTTALLRPPTTLVRSRTVTKSSARSRSLAPLRSPTADKSLSRTLTPSTSPLPNKSNLSVTSNVSTRSRSLTPCQQAPPPPPPPPPLPPLPPLPFKEAPRKEEKTVKGIKVYPAKVTKTNTTTETTATTTPCPAPMLKPTLTLAPSGTPMRSLGARASELVVGTNLTSKVSSMSCGANINGRYDGSSTNVGDHLPTPKSTARLRVAENNKIKVFESLQKKLSDFQSDFMEKFDILKQTCPDKLKGSYKFISMVTNNDCKLVVREDDLLRMPKKLPQESVNDYKNKVRDIMNISLLKLIDCVRRIKEGEDVTLEQLEEELTQEHKKRLSILFDGFNALCSTKNVNHEALIEKLEKEIKEQKAALEKAEHRYDDSMKKHELEMKTMESKMTELRLAEIAKKDVHIAELQRRLKVTERNYEKAKQHAADLLSKDVNQEVNEELRMCKENMITMQARLNRTDQSLQAVKRERHAEAERVVKLEQELRAAQRKYDEFKYRADTDLRKLETANGKLKDRVKELESTIENLENEKKHLEYHVSKIQLDQSCLSDLHMKLKEANKRIRYLEEEAFAREQLLAEAKNMPKEVPPEIAALRKTDQEKRREIEILRSELLKNEVKMAALEEQIRHDQQLLHVRSELIDSLQTNEITARAQLEELYAQISEKSSLITELNGELHSKSEEFRNLFTTLSAKHVELARQEHLIKLLEESNERSHMVRVKQEEKIGQLEEEIMNLRQTISLTMNAMHYTAALTLPNNRSLSSSSTRKRRRRIKRRHRPYSPQYWYEPFVDHVRAENSENDNDDGTYIYSSACTCLDDESDNEESELLSPS